VDRAGLQPNFVLEPGCEFSGQAEDAVDGGCDGAAD